MTTVTFTPDNDRYRVDFAYDPATVALLKHTVPGPMRRWDPTARHWTISVDWVGPLAVTLAAAGVGVYGLGVDNIDDWYPVFATAAPAHPDEGDAYRKGFCKTCRVTQCRPGGVECRGCYRNRLQRQYRVSAALVRAGATGYPRSRPAAGDATSTRYPLLIDDDIAPISRWALEVDDDTVEVIDERRHTEVLDLLIEAQPKQPTCLVCDRHGASQYGMVHVICRTRLLRHLHGQPFTKVTNAAWQDGLCPVCFARPHVDRRETCSHCGELANTCRSLRIHSQETTP
jgi:hypothetical protein